MTIAVGIDLGTSRIGAGVYLNGEINIITTQTGKRYIPAYVAFTRTQRLIGDLAEDQVIANPKNTVFGVKRFIGRKFDDIIVQKDKKFLPYEIENYDGKPKICVTYKGDKRVYDPEEISAMLLNRVKMNAEVMLGHQITAAVITVPAFFNDSQRQATKDAGEIAGLEVLRILNESTAAAIAYGLDKTLKSEKNVLVYDLGSGTFDTSILKIKEGSLFEVQATVGDMHIGGIDIDNNVFHYIADLFNESHGKDIRTDILATRRLKSAWEDAKITLTKTDKALVIVDSIVDGIDLNIIITRSKFEELCEPIFKKTIVLLERLLQESGISKEEIEDVVLVGGSSRIPKIQNLVRNYFEGKFLRICFNPDEAVTYGAAVQAAILSGYKDRRIKDMLFVDVTPLSIGIETSGGVMTIVIERNTSIPCRESYTVTTYKANQRGLTIKVFEGERALTADNHLLGKLELTGFPPLPPGVLQIEVTFDIDSNGILTVSAEENVYMDSKSMVIKLDKGRLSPRDIDRMLKETKEFKKKDEEERYRIQYKNSFHSYMYSIKKAALSESEAKISNRDKLEIHKIFNEMHEWLQANPTVDKETLLEKRKIAVKLLQPYTSLLSLSARMEPDEGRSIAEASSSSSDEE